MRKNGVQFCIPHPDKASNTKFRQNSMTVAKGIAKKLKIKFNFNTL